MSSKNILLTQSLPVLFLILLYACQSCTHSQSRSEAEQPKKEIIYIGTFSVRGSEGIYAYSFDREHRRFKPLNTAATPESPSFLALSPDGRYL